MVAKSHMRANKKTTNWTGVVLTAMPAKMRKRVAKLARDSRREEDECVQVLLDWGMSHIGEEPWFYAMTGKRG